MKTIAAPMPNERGILAFAQELLTQLSMTTAARLLPELLQRAQQQETSYSDFLKDVLFTELGARRERRVARALKRARLGSVKSLEEFNFSKRRRLSARKVKELANCQFITEGRSIICVGKSGTGKTHVAKALGHAACLKGYSVLSATTADLLDDLHAALADGTYNRAFRRHVRADLVILDELGYLPLDRKKADQLFRLVSARHPDHSMIVTTNTGFSSWGSFFPNEAQAVATVDRLLDRATVLRFTGESFREPKDILGDPID